MGHTKRGSFERYAPATAVTLLLFIFLLNFSSSAAALPPQPSRNPIGNDVSRIAAFHAQYVMNTISSNRHIQIMNNSRHELRLNGNFDSQPKVNNLNSGPLSSLSTPYVWVKSAIKAFLFNIWTSIHTHIGGVPEPSGKCS